MSTHKHRNLIVASAVLAGLMSVALSSASVPAEARVVMSECQKRHSYCTERCIMNNGYGKNGFDKVNACIKRTCDKQSPGCGPGSLHSKASSPLGGGKSAPNVGPIGGPIVKSSKGGVGGPVVTPGKGGVITSGGVPKGGVYTPSGGPQGPAGGPILLRSRR